jgi:O-antigen ligase
MGPLIAWSAATLLMARDVLTGVAELKEWVVAWVVGAAAAHFAGDERRARVLLQIVALTGSLIAVLMMYSAVRSPFGWVLAVLLKKVDLPWGRTNYLAGLIILALPVTVGLLGAPAPRFRRVLWLALLIIQSAGLALSASKGAMVALVVGLVVAFAPGGRSSRTGVGVMAAIIALAVGLFALGPLRQVVAYRLQASALAYSVGERTELYRLAWDQFERSPVWGLGLNNFSVAANRLTGVDTVPHNLELGLLAELGVPGFVIAFGWLGALARASWRARSAGRSPRQRSLGLGLWAAFVAFFVHNQMESTIYGEQYKILLMLVAAAAWRLGEGRGERASDGIG